MKATVTHTSNTAFETKIRDHVFVMDTQIAAGGENKGPTPKELLLAGIIGCTAMDVIAWLKKYRMTPESFKVSGDAEPRSAHPRVFKSVNIRFEANDPNIESSKLIEAVELSLSRFCGVSAMVSKVVPIHYEIHLNETIISKGSAQFDL
jgi:putative redox protein